MAHSLTLQQTGDDPAPESQFQFETDRGRFIGRGRTLANPMGAGQELGNSQGFVLDPCLCLRQSLTLAPGQRVQISLVLAAGLAPSIDPVSVEMAQHFWYVDASHAERALGWTSRDPLDTLADTVRDLRTRGVVWPELEGPSALGA